MKKVLLTLPLLAAAMWSCSSDEPTPNGPTGNGETQYIAVSITTSSEAAPLGRAEDEPIFEDGEALESQVKTLDFYFFDAEGNPARVKRDGSNHLTATPTSKDEDPADDNITKTIEAVLVISTEDGDKIPSKILAVINDPTEYKDKTIEQLQDALTSGRTKFGDDNLFVMTNSVHIDGGNMVIATPVAGHLYSTESDALDHPVTIYVERTLAKVRVQTSLTAYNAEDLIYDPNDEKGFGEKIYVKFLGWNVTTLSENNRLVKKINAAWTPSPAWIWNSGDYHRSFWAFNAPDNTYVNYDFNASDGDFAANALTKFDGTDYTYLKENAAIDYITGQDPERKSQVIIAAQLVNAEGKPIEFAEWAFQRMTKDNLTIALADALSLYKGDYKEGETLVRTKITPDDIQLLTATEAGYVKPDDEPGVGRYLVYAALTKDAAKINWYSSTATNATPLSTEDLSAAFKSLGGAKVWEKGYTYYYFDINHLGTSELFGLNGVVRNHVYAADITKLTGLGTPVYNPDEVIIPEKPKDENTYIAAEIKVLAWRVVNFNVELEW